MTDSPRKLIVLSLKWYDVRIHQGVLDYAKLHGWDVVASPHMPQPLDIPEADGQIVMLGMNDPRRTRLVEETTIPVIDLGHYSPLDLPRVYPDNLAAGRMAAEAFLERGFSRFATYGTQSHWYVRDRLRGFSETVGRRGFHCENWHLPQPDLHKGSFSPAGPSRRMIEKWLVGTRKPLAIYAVEDEGAAMLMRACHQLGLAVPEQVALIGTNNDPVICPYTEVPLSSIDLNWEGVGFQAATELDQLMRGKVLEKKVSLVPPRGLVPRKSSETIALEDVRVALALSYIQENSRRHVTVKEITKALGMPLRTLQWAFQKSMNRSIQEEIAKQRVRRIEEMLLHTDRKVGKIADELGFSSAQYMNYFFSKSKGVTPNEYRQRRAAPPAGPG